MLQLKDKYLVSLIHLLIKELTNMELMLCIFCAILVLALIFILIHVYAIKRRAKKENQKESRQISAIEKMREADERTQLMLDSTPLGVSFWDKNHRKIICNEEAARLFGLSSKQEYLDRFEELSPKYQPCGKSSKIMMNEILNKIFEQGNMRFEWMYQKLDGEQIPCEITGVRVEFRGEPAVLAYIRDLRELKAVIAEKEEADERMQILFNASPLGCKLWNRNLQVIECNQEALNLFDMPDKQMFFDKFFELSPEYQPCGMRSDEKAKELVIKAFNEGYCRFEWMHQKINGEQIPSEITLVRVKVKDGYLVAGYIRDLREYKQMINAIEQRDNLLNVVNRAAVTLLQTENETNMIPSIMEGMEVMGRALDVDRVQIWKNEIIDGELHFVHKCEWLSQYGQQKPPIRIGVYFAYSKKPEWERIFLRDEYINSPFCKLPQSDRDFLSSYDIKSVVIIPLFLQDRFWGLFSLNDCRSEKTFSDEEINIIRSGGLMIANAFLRNDMIQNIHNGAIMLENALRTAQEANTAKSKFLATMSHEIRTPMNVILGVTENQLENEALASEVKDAFEKIYDSGDLLLRIINDILDFSKIEAGKLELIPINYKILSLINDVANLNNLQFEHKQILFKLYADENLPLHLFGDDLRIKQIINNLLSNAFKYTDAGEVSLSLTSEKILDEKISLIIKVSDTGQGMSPEQVNKLFDEYSRFNLDTNRATIGTGLGMAITNNLIKMMNGTIHIDSMPGKGSVFTVHIPQTVVGTDVLGRENTENFNKSIFKGQARADKPKIIREPMPYGKVLVVDDMKTNLEVAKLLLKPYQLHIDMAVSGFDAIDIINSGNVYDIIFMDHMMPKMDGIETVQILRKNGYKKPIFALTANAITGQQEIFLANGFDGFISKPIDIRHLDDVLNKFIRDVKRGVQKDNLFGAKGNCP